MFRASSCPSSGAYQPQQQQPLVYRRNVVVAMLLAVVGSVVRTDRADHDQQHWYHNVPTVNQRLLLQLIDS